MDKATKAIIQDMVMADKLVFKKNGMVEARRSFFYTGGYSADKFAEEIKRALSKVGVEIEVVSTEDVWRPWPNDSYFKVVFRVVGLT